MHDHSECNAKIRSIFADGSLCVPDEWFDDDDRFRMDNVSTTALGDALLDLRLFGFNPISREMMKRAIFYAYTRWPSNREDRERNAAERADKTAVVYYIDLGTGYIKIGTTTDIHNRLRGLRVELPALLAFEPGSYDIERRRHVQFAAERRDPRREDFLPSDRLRDHIAATRRQWGLPETHRKYETPATPAAPPMPKRTARAKRPLRSSTSGTTGRA